MMLEASGDPCGVASECYERFGPTTRFFIRRAYRRHKYTKKALAGSAGFAPDVARARTAIRMGIERTATWMGAPGVIVFAYCVPTIFIERSEGALIAAPIALGYVGVWHFWELFRLNRTDKYFHQPAFVVDHGE